MTDDGKGVCSAFGERTGIDADDLAGALKVEQVWKPRESLLLETGGS